MDALSAPCSIGFPLTRPADMSVMTAPDGLGCSAMPGVHNMAVTLPGGELE
jgi:hypothetical protein